MHSICLASNQLDRLVYLKIITKWIVPIQAAKLTVFQCLFYHCVAYFVPLVGLTGL